MSKCPKNGTQSFGIFAPTGVRTAGLLGEEYTKINPKKKKITKRERKRDQYLSSSPINKTLFSIWAIISFKALKF